MARLVTPLTATKINAAKPKEKLYKLSDGSGLALWVYPTGKKTWRFEYRRADKKLDTITFGSFPELSLADAREMRDKNRSLIAKGVDPKIVVNEETVTVQTVFELWYERWQSTVSPKYAAQTHKIITNNLLPLLGRRDVESIKPKDVVSALSPMEERGALEYLRKAKQAFGQVFDFALARGFCEYNPVTSVSNKAFKAHISTNFSALKPEQLPELLHALYTSQIDLITRYCIMWQLLNMCRPAEATNMPWVEMEFDNSLWTIAPKRMKTGREHIVPVSTFGMEIIKEIHKITGSCEYVFVGRSFKTPINRETPRIALRRFKTIGIDTTSHGLRALARTYLEESGLWRHEVMESALAHVEKNKVVAAYNRAEYIDEKRKMLEWWGEEVRKHMPK